MAIDRIPIQQNESKDQHSRPLITGRNAPMRTGLVRVRLAVMR